MKFKYIIKNITNSRLVGNANEEISDIKINSKKINKGDLFVCIKGNNFDSHDFIEEAIINGAVAIICEKPVEYPITQLIVDDSRTALSIAASNFYNNPSKQLRTISVVGTNGKTTTAYLLNKVFRNAGCKTALIGTVEYDILGEKIPSSLTTPDPLELQALMRKMVDSGVEYLFMEVSAHSIYYNKVYGIMNKAIIFTNCTQDHLDFFGSMEDYKATKKSYFSIRNGLLAVVNIDDSLGMDIVKECRMPVLSYGINNPADVFAIDLKSNADGLSFTINIFDIIEKMQTNMCGIFNVYNILAVCTVAVYFGIPIEVISDVLSHDCYVPGRFNITNHNGYSLIIDYAHTEDGLYNLLSSARALCENKKLITVFGCGGNRDRDKRAKMGRVASEYSDYVIITNDNPRLEEERAIAGDIEAGLIDEDINYEIITNRKNAIKKAMSVAREGDIIVIAGKGAEDYMDILGKKIAYSDFNALNELIAEGI